MSATGINDLMHNSMPTHLLVVDKIDHIANPSFPIPLEKDDVVYCRHDYSTLANAPDVLDVLFPDGDARYKFSMPKTMLFILPDIVKVGPFPLPRIQVEKTEPKRRRVKTPNSSASNSKSKISQLSEKKVEKTGHNSNNHPNLHTPKFSSIKTST